MTDKGEDMPVAIRPWNPTPATLAAPLRWRKPALVEVVPDVFAPDIAPEILGAVMAAASARTPHLWLISTAHPERIRPALGAITDTVEGLRITAWGILPRISRVLLGVRCTDQASLDAALPHLFAGLRGPIDFEPRVRGFDWNYLTGEQWSPALARGHLGLSWVRVRGGAEPINPSWLRSIRDQCAAAGVPWRFEGWGSWFPSELYDYDTSSPALGGRPEVYVGPAGQIVRTSSPFDHGCPCCVPHGYASMVKIGPRRSGRTLDGREHLELPGREG
jgi:protein gp37